MQPLELVQEGQHVMTVCNACRYCEQYCPVFPAMERRLTFTSEDLGYLANLCHNCGECLYACQYAPPHEFGINVPRTLAALRLQTYEQYGWPRPFGALSRRHGIGAGLVTAAAATAVLYLVARLSGSGAPEADLHGNFYAVVPHDVMVAVFGTVGLFVVVALAVGVARFWRDSQRGNPAGPGISDAVRGLRDALTLRHLHTTGFDCTSRGEERSPWRRWFHHATFYGFLFCFASTSVAAIYHSVFGWRAPYAYTSLPVVLGTIGGLGLVLGPAGLFALRRARDPELTAPDQPALDDSFIVLLVATSLTGLALLVLRDSALMAWLLVVHLGFVLALFATLPYGKFVHGFYRTAALVKYAMENVISPGP
jgi:citrate/tricarballylate utilization protein